MPVLGQIWPFLSQNSIFWGERVKLLVPSYQESNETPFSCWNIGRWGSNWSLGGKMCFFGPKNFFYSDHDFCQWGISQVYPGLQLSHSDHPEKNSVSEQWVIFRGSPLFLALLGNSHARGISTLNFGPFSMKLGGIVQAIKKMTQNDNGPVRAGITTKQPFLRSAEKCFFGWKCFLSQKTHEIS